MAKDIFCKMIAGDITPDLVMETDEWIAVNDIHPQTPTHILIIPKKHIASGITDIGDEDQALVGRLLQAASTVAQKAGIKEDGFRVIINSGEHGGQTIPHLHIHVLGGRHMGETMVK